MKTLNVIVIASAALLGLVASFSLGQQLQRQQAKRASEYASNQLATYQKNAVSAFGTLEPFADVHVLAGPLNELGGAPRVKQILVSEGNNVSKGQILVVFDNKDRLYAERAKLIREIVSKQAEIKILQSNIIRFVPLARDGSYPLSDFEDKKVRLASFQSQLQELLGALKSINTRIESDTVIKSPINGSVLRVNARPGERPGTQGVLEVGNISRMQAVVQVDEGDIGSVRVGQKAIIKSENRSFNESLRGVIGSVGLSVTSRKKLTNNPAVDIDPEERVVDVRIFLDTSSSLRVKRLTGAKVNAYIETKS